MIDDDVHIKIELFKDSNSGKMALRVHFDDDAPNVIMENKGCYWKPTTEEEKILHEAFNLLSFDKKTTKSSEEDKNYTKHSTYQTKEEYIPETQPKYEPKMKSKFEEEKTTEPIMESKTDFNQNPEPKTDSKFEKEKVSEPVMESRTESGFEHKSDSKVETIPSRRTDNKEEILETPKPEEKKKHLFGFRKEKDTSSSDKKTAENEPKVDVKSDKEFKKPADAKDDSDKFFKEDLLVSDSNNEDVEDVEKKHSENEDDEKIVEADEKTILDRVLSQKKKGKWRK